MPGRELREQLHLKGLRGVGIHGAFLTKVRVSKEIVTERGRMLNTSSLKEYAYAARLDGGHHDMAIRLLALGMSDNPIVLTQGEMNQATLVCVHRGKRYLAVTTLGALGSGPSNVLKLVSTTALIPLNIHDDGIVELDVTAQERGEDRLEGVERTTMTPNENSEVSAVNIENQLAVLTVILVNGGRGFAEEAEDTLEVRDGKVSNLVHLVIAQSLARLVALADGGELVSGNNLPNSLIRGLEDLFLNGNLQILFKSKYQYIQS